MGSLFTDCWTFLKRPSPQRYARLPQDDEVMEPLVSSMTSSFGNESCIEVGQESCLKSDIKFVLKICNTTELAIHQCNCDECMLKIPPMSLSDKPIHFSVVDSKLYCNYEGDSEMIDVTEETDLACKRNGLIKRVLFNGVQFSFS